MDRNLSHRGSKNYNACAPTTVNDIANDFPRATTAPKDKEQEQLYVNEHERLVFGDLLSYTHYNLGLFVLSLDDGKYRVYRHNPNWRQSSKPLHSQVSRWMSSSSSRKMDLQNRYDAIILCHAQGGDDEISWTQTSNRHRLQPTQYRLNGWHDSVDSPPYQKALYAPGSILTDPPSPQVPSTLVGRVRPWPHEWKWDISLTKGPPLAKEVVNLSFDKFVIQLTNF